MKLGFHYHMPAGVKNEKIVVQSFLGVFLDSLANRVDQLHLFLHYPIKNEWVLLDYELKSPNVILHDLGPHNAMPFRLFFRRTIFKSVEKELLKMDSFLVRSPSPLSPFLVLKYYKMMPFSILLVGNYITSSDDPSLPFWKNFLIRIFSHYIHFYQNLAVKKSNVLVNSKLLFEENKNINSSIKIIKTTTLNINSFYKKIVNNNSKRKIKIIYSGRIDLSKGLLLIVEALSNLFKKGYDIEFHIVGWEPYGENNVQNEIINFAKTVHFSDRIFFLGKKTVGDDLNAAYRFCDIFVIGSIGNEGFPRSIWEAMANSLPVVATSVGSIPHFLRNRLDAMIVSPSNVHEIETAVEELIINPELSNTLIKNGYNLALESTLEIQSEILINSIKESINK